MASRSLVPPGPALPGLVSKGGIHIGFCSFVSRHMYTRIDLSPPVLNLGGSGWKVWFLLDTVHHFETRGETAQNEEGFAGST